MTSRATRRTANRRRLGLASRSGAAALGILATLGTTDALAFADGGPEPPTRAVDAASLEGLNEILNILSSSAADSRGRGLALAHLVARGPRSVPAIFSIFTGSAPVPQEMLDSGPLLTRQREELLFDAMRSWDSRRVAEELQTLLQEEATLSRRIVAVRLLGEVANARSVEIFFDVVGGLDPTELAHPVVRGPAVEAMSRALTRDPLCYVVLATIVRDLTDEQLDFAVDAMARAGRLEGLDILEGLLGRSPELDERVLSALGDLGIRELALAGARVRGLVHPYVASTHAGARIQAARVLGVLKDSSSFLELIELLDDRDADVAQTALEALQSIAGTAWPADPARWQNWYARERRWLEDTATGLAGELEIGNAEAAMKAIRELAAHPLFRMEVANTIGRAVDHQSRAVAVLACESLGQLRCPEALDLLVEALYDPRSVVREAAADSLRASTGEQLPTDGSTWRRWLEG